MQPVTSGVVSSQNPTSTKTRIKTGLAAAGLAAAGSQNPTSTKTRIKTAINITIVSIVIDSEPNFH